MEKNSVFKSIVNVVIKGGSPMANAVSFLFKNIDSKILKKSEPFQEYVAKMTLELKDLAGPDADLDVKLDTDGPYFNVSVRITGVDRPIYVNKKARLALSALKKCKNVAFRKVKKEISKKHNHYHFIPKQRTV